MALESEVEVGGGGQKMSFLIGTRAEGGTSRGADRGLHTCFIFLLLGVLIEDSSSSQGTKGS